MDNKLYNIEQKLKKIEQDAVGKSPSYKNWLRMGYKLLLVEKARLIKSAQKQEQTVSQLDF